MPHTGLKPPLRLFIDTKKVRMAESDTCSNSTSTASALTFGGVCSGIEAASVAWESLGWRASFVFEVVDISRNVLAARHPHVPLHGNFITIQPSDYYLIDALASGILCQSFCTAGLRKEMADERGNLALEYLHFRTLRNVRIFSNSRNFA